MTLGRKKTRQGGFTLLEVVVALAMLAITLSVVYETLGWSLRREVVAQRKTAALLTAQSLLSTVATQPALRVGTQADRSLDGRDRRIEIREHPSRVSSASPIVAFDIAVTVQWGAKPSQTVQMSSLVLASRAQ